MSGLSSLPVVSRQLLLGSGLFRTNGGIVELGTSSRIMVILSTGRNDIATAQVKLSAPSGIQFRYEEAELSGDGE